MSKDYWTKKICNTLSFQIGKYHSNIPQFYLCNIEPCDSFRPIVRERKYFMDYKSEYTTFYKYGKRRRDFWGNFHFNFILGFFILWALLKQLFHSRFWI